MAEELPHAEAPMEPLTLYAGSAQPPAVGPFLRATVCLLWRITKEVYRVVHD